MLMLQGFTVILQGIVTLKRTDRERQPEKTSPGTRKAPANNKYSLRTTRQQAVVQED